MYRCVDIYAHLRELTCKLTFLEEHIDRLVDNEGDHAPRHKAEVDMHGCEDSRRWSCVEQETETRTRC